MHSVIKEALALQNKKAGDYGDYDVAQSEYFPYGDESYLTMLHIKLKRLDNLKNKDAKFESAYDSVLDVINYAAMYGAYLKNKHD